jgi:diketogulonate reductase-like aldo/keto reductase
MQIDRIDTTVRLNNGVEMPMLGLGTWQTAEGEEAVSSVRWALEAGYRHIDTAAVYGNERGVGQAIRESGIPRDQIFVTTKVWNDALRAGRVEQAMLESLERLGLDHVDLYLIHWPVAGKFLEAWRTCERLHEEGLARAIGLSNFLQHHIQPVLDACEVMPAVDQVELHPHMQLPDLRRFCASHGIVVEAWSPIMRGEVLEVPELVEIGQRHGKNAVQVTLRWELQLGLVTIPKSVHRERIVDNADVFDFELSDDDELSDDEMNVIAQLDQNRRLGADPDNFSF